MRKALDKFAKEHGFRSATELGDHVNYAKEPDLEIAVTFDNEYIDVTLWRDPDAANAYRRETEDLTAALTSLGFVDITGRQAKD